MAYTLSQLARFRVTHEGCDFGFLPMFRFFITNDEVACIVGSGECEFNVSLGEERIG